MHIPAFCYELEDHDLGVRMRYCLLPPLVHIYILLGVLVSKACKEKGRGHLTKLNSTQGMYKLYDEIKGYM